MGRLFVISVFIMVLFTSLVQAEEGKTVYNKICYYCHEDNLVGAPKIGDADAWDERRKKGIPALYYNVLFGAGHMMERLDRQGYNEADIKRAVDYLLGQSE